MLRSCYRSFLTSLAMVVAACSGGSGGSGDDSASNRGTGLPSGSGESGEEEEGPILGGNPGNGDRAEACGNGLDDDGDGAVDEDCACIVGKTQPCYTGDGNVAGIGGCALGSQTCEAESTSSEFQSGAWGSCVGSVQPQQEACDGFDNDCDGQVDEGCDEGGAGGSGGGSGGGGGTGGAGGSGGTGETGGGAGSGGTAGTGGGPGECVVIPAYGGSFPYKTYALNAAPSNFWQFAFDDSDFQQGNAPFGSGGDCSIQSIVETHWPSPSDIVLRKRIQLTDTSLPLRILVAIDNDVWVFFNEIDVSGGLQPHEDCADTNRLEFVIPTSAMRVGDNLLAVLGRDRHVEAALDIELVYDECQ